MPERNRKKNKYQLFTIICVVLGLLYAYAFYNAYKTHHEFNTYLYGGISLGWLLVAFYWYKTAQKEL